MRGNETQAQKFHPDQVINTFPIPMRGNELAIAGIEAVS